MNLINEDNRVEKGIFGFSFLSWQGNQISFEDSKWVSIIIVSLTFVLLMNIIIFRKYLIDSYKKHEKLFLNIFQIIGIFILCLSVFRTFILAYGNYPNLWELIPFHFCRLFIVIISLFLVFKKVEVIKYVGFFAVNGGIIGLLISDLSSSDYWNSKGGTRIGYDNYIFWDFYIIHVTSILVSAYLISVNKFIVTKWDVLISCTSVIFLTIGLFFANWFFSFLPDQRWQANWFYLAPDKFNGIDELLYKFLGRMSKWPAILPLFIFIGTSLYLFTLTIYFWLDKYEININSKTITTKSFAWEEFKKSSWV